MRPATGKHDVRAVGELREGEFLALVRVTEGIGIGDDDLSVRVDRLDTGAESDLVANDRWDALTADDADLVGLVMRPAATPARNAASCSL